MMIDIAKRGVNPTPRKVAADRREKAMIIVNCNELLARDVGYLDTHCCRVSRCGDSITMVQGNQHQLGGSSNRYTLGHERSYVIITSLT
jgi:hypothetical protein